MNRIEKTRQYLLKKGLRIINLSSGNASEHGIFFDAALLEAAWQKFLQKPAYHPDPKGDLSARKAIQSYYKERGLNVRPDQIILTSGTSESYFYLFRLLARPGEKILFPNPGYPLFEEIARLADIECAYYKLDEKTGWQIDPDNLATKIRPDTRAIVLISPNNPTGSVLSRKTLTGVFNLAQKYDLPVICDEVFSEFIFDGKNFLRAAALAKDVTVFTLNGISKTFALPGLKLSWILVTGPQSRAHLENLERSADAFLSCNQITQSMLPYIMRSGKKFLKNFQKRVESNRNLAIKILAQYPQIEFHKPEGGFYLFARIKGLRHKTGSTSHPNDRALTDEEFVIKLMKKAGRGPAGAGIFVHPGYFYDYDKGLYILISLLPPAAQLQKCLTTITEFTAQVAASFQLPQDS